MIEAVAISAPLLCFTGNCLLTQNSPGDIGAKFFATHPGGQLYRWAVLGGDVSTRLPHARRTGRDTDSGRQSSNATRRLDCTFKSCCHLAPFCYHIRDYAPNTNVLQAPVLITGVKTLENIAARLAWARKERNLSQERLAALAKVSQGTIGNIESGLRESPRELLAIAKAAGVNAEWLKTGKGPIKAELPPQELAALSVDETDGRHEVSESDFGVLADVKLVLMEDELAAIRKRAEHVRRQQGTLIDERAIAAKYQKSNKKMSTPILGEGINGDKDNDGTSASQRGTRRA